jgi:hypothetical protein
MSRFQTPLERPVEADNLSQLAEVSRFNEIYDEAGLHQVIGSTIIMPVSRALPKSLFVTTGGFGGVSSV